MRITKHSQGIVLELPMSNPCRNSFNGLNTKPPPLEGGMQQLSYKPVHQTKVKNKKNKKIFKIII